MNNVRRKEAEALRSQIEDARSTLYNLTEDLGNLRDEEQEGFDNMSEGLQQAETGQRIEAAASHLGEAYDVLDSALEDLMHVMTEIDEAVGA